VGVIGDPARADRRALLRAAQVVRAPGLAFLGYTHFWRETQNQSLRGHVMASCDELVRVDLPREAPEARLGVSPHVRREPVELPLAARRLGVPCGSPEIDHVKEVDLSIDRAYELCRMPECEDRMVGEVDRGDDLRVARKGHDELLGVGGARARRVPRRDAEELAVVDARAQVAEESGQASLLLVSRGCETSRGSGGRRGLCLRRRGPASSE
jgi:hypothetical protein